MRPHRPPTHPFRGKALWLQLLSEAVQSETGFIASSQHAQCPPHQSGRRYLEAVSVLAAYFLISVLENNPVCRRFSKPGPLWFM